MSLSSLSTAMAKPTNTPASHSAGQTSKDRPGPPQPQLSDPEGVQSDVSSIALDRGLLSMAGLPASGAGVSPDGLTDAEVMLRVKAGDESAFEYLLQKYRRSMVSFMYRMAHNSAAAEDLAQEVFLRVYRSRGSYEASAKFTTWLYRIATNLAVNYARDTRRERPENTVSLDEPADNTRRTMDIADGSLTVEEVMVRRERLAAVRQRVQALPERQRMAGVMHKYQQMDYRPVAEV